MNILWVMAALACGTVVIMGFCFWVIFQDEEDTDEWYMDENFWDNVSNTGPVPLTKKEIESWKRDFLDN